MPYVLRQKGTDLYYLTGAFTRFGDLRDAEVYNELTEARLDLTYDTEEICEVALTVVRVVDATRPYRYAVREQDTDWYAVDDCFAGTLEQAKLYDTSAEAQAKCSEHDEIVELMPSGDGTFSVVRVVDPKSYQEP